MHVDGYFQTVLHARVAYITLETYVRMFVLLLDIVMSIHSYVGTFSE